MTTRLQRTFPNLALEEYEVTSPETDQYNCIAWAAGETRRWWWPDPMNMDYWPVEFPREESVTAFVMAFETLGYAPCDPKNIVPGVEAVVLFADQSGLPTHAVRFLRTGKWTSKLGAWEDITHDSLGGVAGQYYGEPAAFLIRQP